MANQGGSHEQHVKAGQQSHKNQGGKQASGMDEKNMSSKSSSGKQGGSHEQHVNAGKQSHKNSH